MQDTYECHTGHTEHVKHKLSQVESDMDALFETFQVRNCQANFAFDLNLTLGAVDTSCK